jgi:hypothetical protein
MVGYWALDNYTKTVTVWQMTSGEYYAVASYSGTWTTYEGALSPQNGTTEPVTATGTFQGGYIATFTGTLNTSLRTQDNIGTINMGGSRSDILLGIYSKQTGDSTYYNWATPYFGNSVQALSLAYWSWTYQFGTQTWINSYYGNSGDIVV